MNLEVLQQLGEKFTSVPFFANLWYLLQEDERLREEKDERKRKYNVTYSNDVSDVLSSLFIKIFVAVSFLGEV